MSASFLRIGEHFCGAASRFGSLNLGGAICAASILQAGAVHLQKTDPRIAKDTYKITFLLLPFNALGAFWAAGKLVNTLQDHYQISLMGPTVLSHNWALSDWSSSKIVLYNGAFIPAACITAKATWESSKNIGSLIKKDSLSDTFQVRVKIEQDDPTLFKFSRFLYVLQMSSNVALLIFGSNRLQTALTLSFLGLAFFCSASMDWHKFSSFTDGHAKKITYFTLIVPDHQNDQNGSICSQHDLFSKKHLIKKIASSVLKIACHADDRTNYTQEERHDQHGNITRINRLTIPTNLLPQCETCHEQTVGASLHCERSAFSYLGKKKVPKSDLIPVVFLACAAMQLALVILQRKRVDLAGSIYKAQLLLGGVDALAILGKVVDHQEMYHTKWGAEGALAILVISAVAAGYLYNLHIEEIGPNLASQLKGIIPDNALQHLQINYAAPFSFRFLQWMIANKILLDLAIAPHSKNSSIHLMSAIVEGIALLYFSKLKWLNFQRNIQMPLLNTPFKLFDLSFNEFSTAMQNNFRRNLLSTNLSFQFLIPDEELLFPTAAAFNRTIKGIYDYSSEFFKDSNWHCFVQTNKGVRSLIFNAQVIPRPLQIGNIDFLGLLSSWSGRASLRWKGTGNLNLFMQ